MESLAAPATVHVLAQKPLAWLAQSNKGRWRQLANGFEVYEGTCELDSPHGNSAGAIRRGSTTGFIQIFRRIPATPGLLKNS